VQLVVPMYRYRRLLLPHIGRRYDCRGHIPLSSFDRRRSLATIVVSRSRFRPDTPATAKLAAAAAAAEKKKTPSDGGSWPRSLVIGFFAAMSVAVPYTTSWYLSQNGETREQLVSIFNLHDDHALWDAIRRRFGERDYSVVDDETIYKFEDEPDYAIRQDQAEIRRRGNGTVTVQLAYLQQMIMMTAHHNNNNNNNNEPLPTRIDRIGTEQMAVLPASTLARPDSFPITTTASTSTSSSISINSEEKPGVLIVALEFPDDEEEERMTTTDVDQYQITNDSSSPLSSMDGSTSAPTTTTRRMVPYQTYSAWHYHPEAATAAGTGPKPETASTRAADRRLAIASELFCINDELTQLDREVQLGRSMDDPYVLDRVRQLRADRRRLQWSQWWG
jgi:hypothetical protein